MQIFNNIFKILNLKYVIIYILPIGGIDNFGLTIVKISNLLTNTQRLYIDLPVCQISQNFMCFCQNFKLGQVRFAYHVTSDVTCLQCLGAECAKTVVCEILNLAYTIFMNFAALLYLQWNTCIIIFNSCLL